MFDELFKQTIAETAKAVALEIVKNLPPQQASDKFPSVMDVDQVAAYLDISTTTVYAMKNRGELPYFNCGGIKFNKEQIDKWRLEQAEINQKARPDPRPRIRSRPTKNKEGEWKIVR